MMISASARLCTLAFLWLITGSVHAADRLFAFPPGWTMDPWTSPAAGASGVVGVVLAQGNPFDGSRFMQIRGNDVRFTSIPGKVVYVRFAPDGSKAVLGVSLPTQEWKTFLVDAEGNVLWQRSDARAFAFSASGTHLLAWHQDVEGPPPTGCAIYDLNGTLVHSVTWEKSVHDALLLDSTTVLLGIGHSILAYNTETGQTTWRHDLTATEPGIQQLFSFRPGQVLVRLQYGGFKILSSQTGAAIYSYHPWTLATGQPNSVAKFYASFRPYAAPANEILLFNGSSNGMRVNPADGGIVSRQLPVTGPPNHRLNEAIFDNKLVFLSQSGVLLRPIP